MTVHIDFEKAQSLVAECIAERGEDFVYPKQDGLSCMYVHGITEIPVDEDAYEYTEDFSKATPGCIVGAVMAKAGISLEDLGKGSRNESGSFDLINSLECDELVTVSDQASNYLANAQTSQDRGVPWGVSAKLAAEGKSAYVHYDNDGKPLGKYDAHDNYSVA